MTVLQKKIDFAVNLLRNIPQDGPIEVCYSGGKDSDVILELAKMAGIPFDPIYKNTTIDPPGTLAHCRDKGVRIMQPKKSFFQLVEENGWPSRWARFCCATLKEYKIHFRKVIGVRRAESTKRARLYKEPEVCRVNPHGEKERIYYPILEWTNEDVTQFIAERGIKCHPLYYDEEGTFHVERRLGCVGCPLATGCGRKDFEKYPKMLKAWLRAYKRWWDTHGNAHTMTMFPSIYAKVTFTLFFRDFETFKKETTSELFPEMNLNYKQYLEDYFGIDLTV